jgi:hypothetical protein
LFNGNSAHGLLVDTNGAITVNGVPTAGTLATTPAGTIVAQANGAAGVWIEQTPGATQANVLNGLVVYANLGNANGMRIVGGSNVRVLNSWFLKNGGNGVIVSTGNGGTTAAANNDISNINLGIAGGNSDGNNVFQQPQTENANGGSGICLAIASGHTAAVGGTAVAPQALNAAGDQFTALNCATQTGSLQLNPASCANNTHTGGGTSPFVCANGICDLGLQGGTVPLGTTAEPNTFTVTGCTQ